MGLSHQSLVEIFLFLLRDFICLGQVLNSMLRLGVALNIQLQRSYKEIWEKLPIFEKSRPSPRFQILPNWNWELLGGFQPPPPKLEIFPKFFCRYFLTPPLTGYFWNKCLKYSKHLNESNLTNGTSKKHLQTYIHPFFLSTTWNYNQTFFGHPFAKKEREEYCTC